MTIEWQEQLRPGVALKGIVQQATAALIAMDADRLEELALCCADLNRGLEGSGLDEESARALRSAASDLELLKCILHETRANLAVLSRLHTMRIREALWLGGRTSVESRNPGAEAFSLRNRERTLEYGDN
jgi:hypothetical protein